MPALTVDAIKTKLLAYKAEHDKATSQAVQLEAQLGETRLMQRRLEGAMGAMQELLAESVQPAPAAAPPAPPGDVAPKAEG